MRRVLGGSRRGERRRQLPPGDALVTGGNEAATPRGGELARRKSADEREGEHLDQHGRGRADRDDAPLGLLVLVAE